MAAGSAVLAAADRRAVQVVVRDYEFCSLLHHTGVVPVEEWTIGTPVSADGFSC